MKIYYSPSYVGPAYLDLDDQHVSLDTKIVETQGLLDLLAKHACIHCEIPPYQLRLTNYYKSLRTFDDSLSKDKADQETNPDKIFHESFAIDGLNVAKTLLGWRDTLALAGWNSKTETEGCSRLNTLAKIDAQYFDDGLAPLLRLVYERVENMTEETMPKAYRSMEICVPCKKELLPDYIIPLLDSLERIKVKIEYGFVQSDGEQKKPTMRILEFEQQYKADAWLSQQDPSEYQVWINTDSKRLDNWLHLSGRPAAGSTMQQSNPQISQLPLLAIQLFQRPLNVNTLLQYLYLPESPLEQSLSSRLASKIVSSGGFCNEEVSECIENYLHATDSNTFCKLTSDERTKNYNDYLPFDLRKADLTAESDTIDCKQLHTFLQSIKTYAVKRIQMLVHSNPHDLRIAQFQEVADITEALLKLIGNEDEVSYSTLMQWALALRDTHDYTQYPAQINSQFVISNPGNIISKAENVIWCDLYGDVPSARSTDFLSPNELSALSNNNIKLWNPQHEAEFNSFMLKVPQFMTTGSLTFVECKKQGQTILPVHPIRLQLSEEIPLIKEADTFDKLPTINIQPVNNHRESDDIEVTFDAGAHPAQFRRQESFSSLEKILQKPLDYFLQYVLNFSERGLIEIKLPLTYGNVAHETIEELFTKHTNLTTLLYDVKNDFDNAFQHALAKRGALLLLPENHFKRSLFRFRLSHCVEVMAQIIQNNRLSLIECERKLEDSIGLKDNILVTGFIDMLFIDPDGKYVVVDLKWTSHGDQYRNRISNNRDLQLAIYRALLQKDNGHPETARTAFFVMPECKLYSADKFNFPPLEPVKRKTISVPVPGKKTPQKVIPEIIPLLIKGYEERLNEISMGKLETSYLKPIDNINYSRVADTYPLETQGKYIADDTGKNHLIQHKAENKYPEFDCFTK